MDQATRTAVPAGRATPDPTHTRRRLGEVLVEQGALTEAQLAEALDRQREAALDGRRLRLGPLLLETGAVSDRQLAAGLSAALGYPLVDLAATTVDFDVARSLPRTLAERNLTLPIAMTDDRLTVACADPTNVVALDDVKAYARGLVIDVVISTETQVRDVIARAWSLSEDSSDVAMILEDFHEPTYDEDDGLGTGLDAPTVRLVNVILADAIRARASDIHIEPQPSVVRVRYRVDGLLRDVMTAPRATAAGIVSRIKVMSNLDIAERRLPQDGRTRLQVDADVVDARVSTLPSLHGEKVVIRLLARADKVPPIGKIGMDDHQLEALLGAVVAPQGLIVICGPTGSGKTNTLYSALQQIQTPDRNIVALEDPVEVQVTGITQMQVNERTGLTFARGLRSVLRQDPDVVLVGEVRDTETAKLALEAAMTGHLVLTTLHTNSAPAAISRLLDMGVEPYLVASSLTLVVSQRLLRKVCTSCAAPYTPPARVLAALGLASADLDGAAPMRGAGCIECGGSGYYGRQGVFEVLPITASMRAVLMSTPTESALAAAARAVGLPTLRAQAVAKAHAGLTTYEEVLRVTHVDQQSGLHCVACGGALAPDMVVCPWCATPVDRGNCATCDRHLEPQWRICPWCRTPAPGGPEVAAQLPSTRTPRLLVVDDDESICSYVSTALSGTIEVTTSLTAGECLELAMEGGYDGVLVDQRLPDMSGVELIRLLRSEARTAALPVALFTGDTSSDIETEAMLAGADDYMTKPVDPLELEERMLALVARSAHVA